MSASIKKEKKNTKTELTAVENTPVKTPFYFYIILISIPILFFILLEVGLRVFNYGEDLSMWVEATPGNTLINPNVARRYFSTVKNLPTTIEDIFDTKKADNSFRVFVLGESSAAGYPYMPLGSFSRYIRKRLEISYPDKKIEVVNIGMTAVNSYTIRDFTPEVLKQHPDVILIYTGHNEYYGALGIGSLESVGNSRALVNVYLSLLHFKTVEMLKDFLQWSAKVIFGNDQPKTGTLMSRMAKEQSIVLGSNDYKAGVEQFNGNMRDVIEMCKDANVPIIMGTLASNLKDQKPFISKGENGNKSANDFFEEANSEYKKGNFKQAEKLYRLAKDNDLLRFRAPEEINNLIKQYGKEFDIEIVDIDSILCAASPNGIVGDNFMTDHLHPTLQGFQLIGKAFYEMMNKTNMLPQEEPKINFTMQDSITKKEFAFSKFDSILAKQRIAILKNDWPYIDPNKKVPESVIIPLNNLMDSLAYKFLSNKTTWPNAHMDLANHDLAAKNFDGYIENMSILLYQYPIIKEYYNHIDNVAIALLNRKEYDNAYKVLLGRYNIKPNLLCTKWLGNIELSKGDIKQAIKYLEEGLTFSKDDLQVVYNLAGAYALNKQYKLALDAVTKVMEKDSNYPGAKSLFDQLYYFEHRPN